MKTSRKIFIISSSRERLIRVGLGCELTTGVSTRTTEGEAFKPECCCVVLWLEPELRSIVALSLSSSSSKIIIGVVPCDFGPGGRFVGEEEPRGRMGSFPGVIIGAVVGICGFPEDSDL